MRVPNQPQSILDLKGTESGRLFFIGSGPSLLTQMDLLPRLSSERTWAINKYPGWMERPLTPNFYSISEPAQCDRHGRQRFAFPHIGDEMTKFAIHWSAADTLGFNWVSKAPVDQTIFHGYPYQGMGDNLAPLAQCYNGFLTAMQLAMWMGFTEFYFVGNEMTLSGYPWEHVDDPFPRIVTQHQQARIFQAYEFVRDAVPFRMVDCTPEGNLNTRGILEYTDLRIVLNDQEAL